MNEVLRLANVALENLGRKPWRTVGGLFATALVVRILWLLINQPVPISDFAEYHKLARNLLEHGQLGDPNPTLKRLPGFPFFLACFMIVGRSPVWLGFVTSVFSSTLVVLTYLLALQVTSQRGVAVLAAGLCALSPTFVGMAPVLASEHIGVPLTLTSVALGLRYRGLGSSGPVSYALVIAAGLSLGAAVLTRGEAIFYVPVVVAVVSFRRGLRGVLAGVLVLVVVGTALTPWYQRNRSIDERAGLSTTSGMNFFLAHNATGYGRSAEKGKLLSGLSEVEQDEKGWQLGWGHVRETHVPGLLSSTARGTVQLFGEPPIYAIKWSTVTKKAKAQLRWNTRLSYRAPGYVLASAFYYGLLVLAVWAWRYKKQLLVPGSAAVLALVAMNWLCYAVVFWGKARYRYLVEVILCIFASVTLYEILRRRSGRATTAEPT